MAKRGRPKLPENESMLDRTMIRFPKGTLVRAAALDINVHTLSRTAVAIAIKNKTYDQEKIREFEKKSEIKKRVDTP